LFGQVPSPDRQGTPQGACRSGDVPRGEPQHLLCEPAPRPIPGEPASPADGQTPSLTGAFGSDRAGGLGVADRVRFIHGDAAGYVSDEKAGVAACIGATWIGGGVGGTIALLAQSLRPGGIILIGEPYWRQLPPTEDAARACLAGSISDFLLLPGLLASFGRLGYDVVEMVLADQDSWDRYEAAKWLTMRRWLADNPDDEFAKEVRARLTSEPERYAAYTREYLGWGVFALMAR